MPIEGLEGPEQEREQRRAHSDERMAQRQIQRQEHRAGRTTDMKGTVMELSGPDFAPYQADPEWDGLGRRAASTPEQKLARDAAVAKTAAKRPTRPGATTIVGGTPTMQNWQRQLEGFFTKLKAMLGIK